MLVKKFNLGFVRVEDNKRKGLYLVDIFLQLYKYIFINDNKYFINDVNPYCAFWIYDQIEFKKFINTKIWKFNWKKIIKHLGILERWLQWVCMELICLNIEKQLYQLINLIKLTLVQ